MAADFILSIDQGTTGTTVLVVDVSKKRSPKVIGRKTVEFPQYYPQEGWVEHDLKEIWNTVVDGTKDAIAQAEGEKSFSVNRLQAVGITNQRETLCVFSRKTGEPIVKAMVWQDKRGADICRSLKKQESWVNKRTGLVLDPYFSGSKVRWLVDNQPEVASLLASGEAILGTIDTYLLFRLTGCESFATESSNASRTLLFDTRKNRFDPELLEMFGVPTKDCLPEVKESAGFFGKTKGLSFLPDGVPISGILGDQQAALAGQGCMKVGEAKCTYGTGAFMLLNTGSEFKLSSSGLLSTAAWSYAGQVTYALEGSSFIAGAAVQFLRDEMGMVSTAAETSQWARDVTASPSVYFVPALAGLGAPHWDPRANGAFLGLTRGTSKSQMIRAVLEGIAFSVGDLYAAMKKDFSCQENVVRVDGGASANDILMQFQADCLNVNIERPHNLETTAMGAALFAGLGVGLYDGLSDLAMAGERERLFAPSQGDDARELRNRQLEGWQRAVRATQVFAGGND